jgi:6-phosphogluconolactonase (cycloisomerase 2 family)
VETNNSTASKNSILAFRRESDGKLTQLKGSPYLTAGTGVVDLSFSLATFANGTPVIANWQRTLLFAVNEGSNTIAVFHIGAEGDLTAVEGSPFASGGYQPVSLTLLGDILTVVNKNGDPAQASAEANAQPNYSTFRVEPNGSLSQYAESTVDATASPAQELAVPQDLYFGNEHNDSLYFDKEHNGNDFGFVFGDDFVGGNPQSFQLSQNGILRQNPPLPLPANLFVGKTFFGGPAPAHPTPWGSKCILEPVS